MITTTLLALFALAASPMTPGTASTVRTPGTARADAPFQDLSFDQALAAAKKDRKIVMIDFFTTWCVPCKKLDKITWKDADVQAWIGKTAVALKLDAEKEVDLAKRFKIEAYPTILFVKSDGTEIDRMLGFKEPAEFVQEATSTLARKDAIARVKEKMSGKPSGPMEREHLGDSLAQSGKYAEALTEYLWCFDHGLEVDPSYVGVRGSFLLGRIAELGTKYPPAIRALEERRDAAEKLLDSGKGGFQDAMDCAALNDNLHTPEKTLAIYDRLMKRDQLTPQMKTAMFLHLREPLMEARRYAEVVEQTGDVEQAAKQSIAKFEQMLTQVLTTIKAHDPDEEGLEDAAEAAAVGVLKPRTVEDIAKHYEALLGIERTKTADSVADILLAFDATCPTFVTLIEHAVRAGANDAARSMVERALKQLPTPNQNCVKVAAEKIPAKK